MEAAKDKNRMEREQKELAEGKYLQFLAMLDKIFEEGEREAAFDEGVSFESVAEEMKRWLSEPMKGDKDEQSSSLEEEIRVRLSE